MAKRPFSREEEPADTGNPLPELLSAETAFVEVCYVPLEWLGVIDSETLRREEFMTRRQLRPTDEAGPGPNMHNIPAFRFGLDYVMVGDRDFAQLSIPSVAWINDIADQYSPNGIRLQASEGVDSAYDLLFKLVDKKYPAAKQPFTVKTHNIFALGDEAILATGLAPHDYPIREVPEDLVTNLSEHDYVDHAGVVTMPSEEADALSDFIYDALTSPEVSGANIKWLAGKVDKLLECYSHYAYCDQLTPSLHDQVFAAYLKTRMTADINSINYILEAALGRPLVFDFDRINERIKLFQSAPVPDSDADVTSLRITRA